MMFHKNKSSSTSFEYIAMLAAFKIFLEAVDVVPYHVVGGFFFVVVILV